MTRMKMAPKPVAVVLIGEHALLRAFVRAWLGRFDGLRVVGETAVAKETLDLVRRHRAALVLMDYDMLRDRSLALLAELRVSFPLVKVIIYFAPASDRVAMELLGAGAAGFVVKSAQSEEMQTAIVTVLEGGVYVSPAFLKSVATAGVRRRTKAAR